MHARKGRSVVFATLLLVTSAFGAGCGDALKAFGEIGGAALSGMAHAAPAIAEGIAKAAPVLAESAVQVASTAAQAGLNVAGGMANGSVNIQVALDTANFNDDYTEGEDSMRPGYYVPTPTPQPIVRTDLDGCIAQTVNEDGSTGEMCSPWDPRWNATYRCDRPCRVGE